MKLNFDVVNDEYLQFIQDLRDKARNPLGDSHGCSILPLQKDAEGQHINVNVQVGGLRKGTLRIRRHDLCLVIYQKPSGSLVHITDFDVFDDLGSLDFGRVPFSVRPSTLVEAVNFLADPQKDITDLKEKDGVRSSLLALHVLLCEGAKLSALALVFSNVFKTGLEVPIYPWMSKLISDWKYLSKELLGIGHNRNSDCNYYVTNPDDNDSHSYERRVIGTTCQDIAKCLGILHRTVPTVFDEYLIYEPVEGECMVELYSVLVYINGGKSGCIYGTIEVKENTTPCSYSIYHRDSTKCEYVKSNGTLSLEGPDGFLDASDLFEMKLDLKDRDTNLQICNGKIDWRNTKNTHHPDMLFSVHNSVLVKGENGYAIVFYTVFENAVVATVEATLERGSDSGACDTDICVCGSIVARSDTFNYSGEYEQKYYQSVLFREVVSTHNGAYDEGNVKVGKSVKLGVPILLSRRVIAVDTNFTFTIEAKLQNSGGEPLVFGSVVMKPQDVGTSKVVIGQPSDSYLLRLRVSWKKKSICE